MKNSMMINLLLAIIISTTISCKKDNNNTNNPPLQKDFDPYSMGDYFVDLPEKGGSDLNPGTYEKPFATWQRAVNVARAGDTVYIRGGVYYIEQSATAMVRIEPKAGRGASGKAGNPICFFNYPGEKPIIDGSRRKPEVWNTGISMSHANFIHFRGLTVRNLPQPTFAQVAGGIATNDCSNLRFENVTVHDIGGVGFRYIGGFGYWPEESGAYDSTFFINCDVYNTCDNLSNGTAGPNGGGSGDGFKADNEIGSFILFDGCRAWNCSDDGFDLSGSVIGVFNNCWSISSGLLDGDGNGFKMAYPRDHIYIPPARVILNCIAAFNRAIGFAMIVADDYPCMSFNIYNNSAYNNDRGFTDSFGDNCTIPKDRVYKNNLRYASKEIYGYDRYSFKPDGKHNNNTWDSDVTVSDEDFVSLNRNELTGSRQEDGSLPKINFLKLKSESDLKGKGVNVGMSQKPDMGVDWDFLDKNK